MKTEASGLIHDAATDSDRRKVAFFPSLFQAASGSIFAGCQIGTAKQSADSFLALYRSRDGGNTWSRIKPDLPTRFNGVPGSIGAGAQLAEVSPGRLLLISSWVDRLDPAAPMFDLENRKFRPIKQLLAHSEDDGETWSAWREFTIPSLKHCTSTGPMLTWSDGTLAYPFEAYQGDGTSAMGTHGAWLKISRDGGETFESPWLVAQDPENKVLYWDQRLCRGPGPGQFVALFWVHDQAKKKDLCVRLLRGSISDRDHRSGGALDTGIPGQIAAPVWLSDGRLLAAALDRATPGTITLWESRDGGIKWANRLVVYSHVERAKLSQGSENIDFVRYWEDMGKWTFGHPAIIDLGSGRVLLSYYAGVPNRLNIYWARVNVGP